MRKYILWGLAFAVSLYGGAILFLYKNQRPMQYTPGTAFVALSNIDLEGAQLVTIATERYMHVRGWYIPPEQGKPLIVYYKGNEGSFSQDFERYQAMSADGYGVIAFDYRGFPMSPGGISEENILNDSLAVYDWAVERGAPVVIWGRSLGSGPAVYVASRRDVAGVLLESPFTSALDVALERYPFIPAGIMKDTFLSREWIGDVDEPVFVAHGTRDRVIPVRHGQDLFAMAPNGYELWIVEGGDHGSLWEDGLWDKAKEFFDGVTGGGGEN